MATMLKSVIVCKVDSAHCTHTIDCKLCCNIDIIGILDCMSNEISEVAIKRSIKTTWMCTMIKLLYATHIRNTIVHYLVIYAVFYGVFSVPYMWRQDCCNWRTNYYSVWSSFLPVVLGNVCSFTFNCHREGHLACKEVDLLMMTVWVELCTSYSCSCHHHPGASTWVEFWGTRGE